MAGFAFEPAVGSEAGFSPSVLLELQQYIEALVASGKLPGAVTMLLRGNQLVHASISGVENVETGQPLRYDSIFPLYSMSKPLTAVAMLLLYDEGKWRLDDPVSRHLPEFGDIALLPDSAGSREPTLVELFTHTAGFAMGQTPEEIAAARVRRSWAGAKSLNELVRRYATYPLGYEPGTDWQYSISTDLLGEIVERISGERIDLFLAKRVFQPLGMTDTTFQLSYDQSRRLVRAHVLDPETGRLRIATDEERLESTFPMGGTSFKSTAADYLRLARMLLKRGVIGDQRIMSEEAVDMMLSNHLSDAFLQTPRKILHYVIGEGNGYGLNGMVCVDPAQAGRPVGKGTYEWGGAYGTWFWIDPENDIAFVGMANRRREPAEKRPIDVVSQDIVYRAFQA